MKICNILNITLLSTFVTFFACGSKEEMKDKTNSELREITDGEAKYKVTFTNLWNEKDHVKFPGNAHFSPVVSVSHDESFKLFQVGEKSSLALEEVAESGATTLITDVLSQAKKAGKALESSQTAAFFPKNVNEAIEFEVIVSKKFPLLSFVSMIAPSPDWIVGQNSINLIQNNKFIENLEFDLYAMDAGTEKGDSAGNFGINNADQNPKKVISELRSIAGFKVPFAKVVITKL